VADDAKMAVLMQLRVRTGADLARCSGALQAAGGDARKALNALAADGFTGGRPRYDDQAPLGCYALDEYVHRVEQAAVAEIARFIRQGGPPISAVQLFSQEDLLPVTQAMAYTDPKGLGSDPAIRADVDAPRGDLPERTSDDDPLLAVFRYRFGLQQTRPDAGPPFEEESRFDWSSGRLPGALYWYELIEAAGRVAGALGAAGCQAAYGVYDGWEDDRAAQLERVRRLLGTWLDDPVKRRAFAALCYATPGKREWLAGLSGER
jgi:hypothetical protein